MHKTISLPDGQKQEIRAVSRDYWIPTSSKTPRKVHKSKPWYLVCQNRLDELVQRYSTAG